MVGVPQKLSKGQEVDVIRILRNKLLTWTVVGFTILAGITGLSLWGIKERIEANMEKLVAAQFEEPRIQQVVRQVAAERASSLLAEQVNPEVTKFKADVQQELLEFNKYLHNLKEHYQAGYQKLSEELAVLKARNRITRLGDKGIHDASREALEKLETIKSKSEDPAIRGAADSEIMRIKGFWAGVTRLRGEKLTAKNPDGSEKKTEDIETKELVEFLLKHPAWQTRALAAQSLGKRKHKGVSEALVTCVQTDQNLEVIKDAVNAFQKVTGYKCPDVFGVELLPKWWEEHAEDVNKKLKNAEQ